MSRAQRQLPRLVVTTWMRGSDMAKRTCSVNGCERAARSRGLCPMHYSRFRRNGDPSIRRQPGNPARPIADRLEDYIERTESCWLWVGLKNEAGYGILNIKGRVRRAHRLMYEIHVGPIPKDRPQLDHLCRVRHCVNPDHLEPVTNRTNGLRGVGPSGVNAAKTHCKHGHPFDVENTYIRPDNGTRQCKACGKARRQRSSTPTEGS